MEELTLRTTSLRFIRRFLGVLAIVAGTAWFIGHLGELRFFDVMYFVFFIILGLSHLTNSFGQELTNVKLVEGKLHIKWFNWFRKKTIDLKEIELVTLKRFEVLLNLRSSKSLKLSLDNFETDQKKQIYEYFISLSSAEGLELNRNL